MQHILTQFDITPDGDRYALQLTMEDGTIMLVSASFEQLDLLSEEIDRRLDLDEG